MKKNAITLHNTVVGESNLSVLIEAAQSAGFDGIEPSGDQLSRFLEAGYSPEEVKDKVGNLTITSGGCLADIERQGYEFIAMMNEAEKMFDRARQNMSLTNCKK